MRAASLLPAAAPPRAVVLRTPCHEPCAARALSRQGARPAARRAAALHMQLRCRPLLVAGAQPGGASAPLVDEYTDDGDDESGDDFDDDWDAPLEELWAGWEDASPENFLAVLLAAVAAGAIALLSVRILVVLCSVFIAGLKYSAVAALLVLFGVFFA